MGLFASCMGLVKYKLRISKLGEGNKRNKPCFCGSGKKYKNCCLLKDKKEYNFSDIQEEHKRDWNEKICLAPEELKKECSQEFIKAHTISKSSNLKQISNNGHVMGFKMALEPKPIKRLIKIGISKASGINMFCKKHDNELFSILEDKKFTFTNQQIFMLSYRAICKELYQKYASVKSCNMILNMLVNDMLNYDSIEEITEFLGLTKLAVRDFEEIKKIFDNDIIKKDYDNIKYYCLIIDTIPQIMTSCAYLPSIDFNKNKIFDIFDEKAFYNYISVSTLALENGGAIIFSWISKDDITNEYCKQFIQSIDKLSNKGKCGALLNWFFTCSENIFWSEEWWNLLNDNQRNMISIFNDDISQNETLNPEEYENMWSLLKWNIIEIKQNIF